MRIAAASVLALAALAPAPLAAHQLIVFASVDCEVVTVEAKFSNGNIAQVGEVRILDGENTLLITLPLDEDGATEVPLASLDAAGGLLVEVDTGSHDNYWILTPEDISANCEASG